MQAATGGIGMNGICEGARWNIVLAKARKLTAKLAAAAVAVNGEDPRFGYHRMNCTCAGCRQNYWEAVAGYMLKVGAGTA